MQLTNVLGLTGVRVLLQLLDSIDISFAMACCLLLLSDLQSGQVFTSKEKLTRKNPLETLTDNQFKKDFRFSKGDIPRILGLLSWPGTMHIPTGIIFSAEICLLMVLYCTGLPSPAL